MAHRFALALALVAGCSSNAFAAPPAKTDVKLVSIGESHSFVSDALGEERTINVYLPPNYSDPNRKFPVLYVVDGGLDQDFRTPRAARLLRRWAMSARPSAMTSL